MKLPVTNGVSSFKIYWLLSEVIKLNIFVAVWGVSKVCAFSYTDANVCNVECDN